MEKYCYSGILSLHAEHLYHLLKLFPPPLPHTYIHTHTNAHIYKHTQIYKHWVKLRNSKTF